MPAAPTNPSARGRVPRGSRPVLVGGSVILVSLGTGLLASAKGEAVLAPCKLPGLDAVGVGSALLLDIGVMLMVLGMLTAALDRFAARTHRPESSRVHP